MGCCEGFPELPVGQDDDKQRYLCGKIRKSCGVAAGDAAGASRSPYRPLAHVGVCARGVHGLADRLGDERAERPQFDDVQRKFG